MSVGDMKGKEATVYTSFHKNYYEVKEIKELW